MCTLSHAFFSLVVMIGLLSSDRERARKKKDAQMREHSSMMTRFHERTRERTVLRTNGEAHASNKVGHGEERNLAVDVIRTCF